MNRSVPGLPVHHQLPESTKTMSIESVMPSNHLILCRPLLLLPSIFSSITAFSNESALRIRWPKYWSFRYNISPSNEHPGLISFWMDWLAYLNIKENLEITDIVIEVWNSLKNWKLISNSWRVNLWLTVRSETKQKSRLEYIFEEILKYLKKERHKWWMT